MSNVTSNSSKFDQLKVFFIHAPAKVWAWIKRISIRRIRNALLYFITGLLCTLTLLLSTPFGSQFTLYLVDTFSPAEVKYTEGIILDDLKLSLFSFENDQLAVKVNNARLKFDLACVWKKQLCIDEISAHAIKLDIKTPVNVDETDAGAIDAESAEGATDTQSTTATAETLDPSQENTLIELPFGLVISKVAVDDFNLVTDAVDIRLSSFNTAVSIIESSLIINESVLDKALIKLLASTEEKPPATGEWPLKALPTIFMPLHLTAELLTINQLVIVDDKEQVIAGQTASVVSAGTVNNANDDASTDAVASVDVQTNASTDTDTNASNELKSDASSNSDDSTDDSAAAVVANTGANPNNNEPLSAKPLLDIDNIVIRLTWIETELSLMQVSTHVNPVGNVALKGKVDFIHPYPLNVELKTNIEDFELWPHINDSNQTLTLVGDLSKLDVALESEGSLVLSSIAHVNLTDESLPYDIDLNATRFTLPTSITDLVQPSSVSVSSKGDMTHHSFSVNGNVSGYGYQQADVQLSGQYDNELLTINTLNFNEEKGKNQLDLVGDLAFGEKTSWAVKVNSTGFTIPDLDAVSAGTVQGAKQGSQGKKNTPQASSEALTGRLAFSIQSKGFWQEGKWAAQLKNTRITGEVNNKPILVTADVNLNDKTELAASELHVNYNNTQIDLSGYSDNNWHVNGKLVVDGLSSWLPEADANINLNLGISGKHASPVFSVDGEVLELSYLDLMTKVINIDLAYQPFDNHQHKVSINSPSISWQDHTLAALKIALNGDLTKQALALNWQGDSSGDVQINDHYLEKKQQFDIDINKAVFSFSDYVLQPDKVVKLSFNQGKNNLSVNHHCWYSSDVKACIVKDRVLKNKDELSLALTLGAPFLKPFLPKNVKLDTEIAGNLTIDWFSGVIGKIKSNLTLAGGYVQMSDEDEWLDLTRWKSGLVKFSLIDSIIDTQLQLIKDDSSPLINVNAKYALETGILDSGLVAINQFNIKTLQPFIPALSLLEGELSSNITMSGKLEEIALNGDVTISKAKVNVQGIPQPFDDVTLKAELMGNKALINGKISAAQETATLGGSIDWIDGPAFDLNLNSESFKLLVSPQVEVTIAPSINAKLQQSSLKISGNVDVLDGKLTIDELPEGSVSLSSDVIIVNDRGEEVVKETRFDIETDIRIKLANKFKIEGQGFVGRIGGELHVTQKAQQPLQLFGGLKIPEGRYKAYGQNLSVEKGLISFNGPVDNPHILIRAVRNIEDEDVVAGIEASGLADSLKIRLFSNPAMQESETLSYLVRGKGLDAETGNTSAAIGVALATGLTSVSGVTSQIEKLPWVNQIEIEGDADQASIAGYLGDKIYIKYGIGIAEPVNELTVRFYVLSRLWVETVSGLEKSADVYYSFDIE